MSASQSGNFNLQEFTDTGFLMVGGRLYTYAFGTTTHKTAYTDAAGLIPQTYTPDGLGGQYIALNARGELPAPLYLSAGSYDLALKTASGSTVWTRRADPIYDATASLSADLAASSGASLMGYMPAGVGASATTLQSQLRFMQAVEIKVTDAPFYAVGNAVSRSANKFYTDATNTVESTDATIAITAALAYAHTLATGYRTVTVDLCGFSYKVTATQHITKNQIVLKNGQICQATENQDCLVFDGETPSTPLMFARLDNVSLQHAFTTATAGVLIRNKRVLGFFEWNGKNIICEGGFRGFMHDGGTIFMSTLQNIWINNVYGSGFYMPGNGATIDPTGGALSGGSTTTYLRNCFVSDVQTIEPAYDIGNKFNTVILDACAADKVSSFGRFDVIQGSMRQCSSEEIRHPIVGTLPNPHYIIEVFSGYGFSVDGFALATAAGFAIVAGAHAFISTNSPLRVSGISGATPNTNYAGIRTNAAIVGGNHGLINCGQNIALNGGRVLPTGGELVFNGQFAGLVTVPTTIFTAPSIALQTSKKYLVEFTYNFGGNLVAPVWLVVMNGSKSKVTLLSDGPDHIGDMLLTVAGSEIKLESDFFALTGPVTITELGAWTR